MVNPLTTDAVARLINKIEDEFQKEIAIQWNKAMENGAVCFGRPIGFDTRRIYLNAANKYWKFLNEDYSNLFESTVKAIESCKPEQFSTRKHIKESAISLAKFLINKGVINEECIN